MTASASPRRLYTRVNALRFLAARPFLQLRVRASGREAEREREREGELARARARARHAYARIYQWQRGEAQTRSSPVILGRVLTSNMRPVERLYRSSPRRHHPRARA